MIRKPFVGVILSVSTSLAVLAGCNPPATTIPKPTPTSSPTASPSADPSANPSASPSADPSATPTASPSLPPDDVAVKDRTTFNGKVYDDDGTPLDGVTIKAKSLSSGTPFEATTTTMGGTYAFNNVPAGVQLEISASKNGYAPRQRVEVLKSNKTGDPNANRYDFGTEDGLGSTGTFGTGYNGLSDKPEVISVTPGRNASGINPGTSFTLKFSEAMDTDTVEDNFAIYAATDETLSVGTVLAGVDGVSPASDGAEAALGGASLIYDSSDFDISWSSDDTEVTFTFADGAHLPTDTESADIPDYLVTLSGVDDGQIKDKSGVTRDEGDDGYFKLTNGDFEMWYKFSINGDEDKPQVQSVVATDDEGSNDEIAVEFSEPMMLNTREGQIMGMGDESPLNAANYEIAVMTGSGQPANGDFDPASDYGVNNIRFDSDDDTNSTVLLQLDDTAFNAGNRVFVRINRNLVDPAGNNIDSSNDEEDDTAN